MKLVDGHPSSGVFGVRIPYFCAGCWREIENRPAVEFLAEIDGLPWIAVPELNGLEIANGALILCNRCIGAAMARLDGEHTVHACRKTTIGEAGRCAACSGAREGSRGDAIDFRTDRFDGGDLRGLDGVIESVSICGGCLRAAHDLIVK